MQNGREAMTQEITYRIRFSFPSGTEERERMLPSVDLFLRSFEAVDRLLAESLGLELEYRRSLKELGEDFFFYSVGLTLRWPRQILLGTWPDPAALRSWMELARNDLFGTSENDNENIGELAGLWDSRARELGLSDALLYKPPSSERLSPLSDDICRAIDVLGGPGAVNLE